MTAKTLNGGACTWTGCSCRFKVSGYGHLHVCESPASTVEVAATQRELVAVVGAAIDSLLVCC